MKSYEVIMEHWQTHKIMFLKVEDCKNMDECIEHVKREHPDYNLERISPIKWNHNQQQLKSENKPSNLPETWTGWSAQKALTTLHALLHGAKDQVPTMD